MSGTNVGRGKRVWDGKDVLPSLGTNGSTPNVKEITLSVLRLEEQRTDTTKE